MIFIDPEQDDSYITFWSQYPDLHDKAETLNVHSQIDKFRIKKQQLENKLKMMPMMKMKNLQYFEPIVG